MNKPKGLELVERDATTLWIFKSDAAAGATRIEPAAFADPATGISAAYVMTRQSPHLIGDPRAQRLIGALYSSL